MTSVLEQLFGLHGRTALVTGSSRGIGAAIAYYYAAAGGEVFVHGTNPDTVRPVVESIRTNGGAAHGLSSDLSAAGSGRRLVEEAESVSGKLDILVINASAQINATLENATLEDLEHQVAVNIRSTVELLQAALPGMAGRGWGRVVNIGSINQLRPKGMVAAYASTKAATHNLIQSQARDYADRGVLLNTLAPGLVDTDRNAEWKNSDPVAWANYVKDEIWMGRAGKPHEMAGAALFLASNACSFMTGEVVVVSGGV